MRIKTQELADLALDWVVAKREGHHVGVISKDEQWQRFISNGIGAELAPTKLITFRASLRPKLCVIEIDGYKNIFAASKLNYSTEWAQGGPIIEREGVELVPDGCGGWIAALRGGDTDDVARGPTPLIAAMRCFVASRLGDEVDIPEGLA